MDSTEFALPAGSAKEFPGYGGAGREAMAQIQFEYELFTNTVTRLSFGSALDSDVREGLRDIGAIPPKTLLIRDLGYFNTNVFRQLEERDLFYVSRLNPQLNLYIKQGDGGFKQLVHEEIVGLVGSGKGLDMVVYLGRETKHRVRLVASELPVKYYLRRLKRLLARKGKLSEMDKMAGQMNLFVTNVGQDRCDAMQLAELYSTRWQIELVFKTWKSILNIDKISYPMCGERLKTVLYAKLLLVMLNFNLISLWEDDKNEVSYFKFSDTLKDNLNGLRQGLKTAQGGLCGWLRRFIAEALAYCGKEYRKGRKKLHDLLQIKH